MRLCEKCWKNLKLNPAYIMHNKKTNENFLLCDKCKDTKIIKEILNEGKWELIYDTPTIKKHKGE